MFTPVSDQLRALFYKLEFAPVPPVGSTVPHGAVLRIFAKLCAFFLLFGLCSTNVTAQSLFRIYSDLPFGVACFVIVLYLNFVAQKPTHCLHNKPERSSNFPLLLLQFTSWFSLLTHIHFLNYSSQCLNILFVSWAFWSSLLTLLLRCSQWCYLRHCDLQKNKQTCRKSSSSGWFVKINNTVELEPWLDVFIY